MAIEEVSTLTLTYAWAFVRYKLGGILWSL